MVITAGAAHKKVDNYLDETLENWGYNMRFKLCFVHSHDSHGYLPLETKEKIEKESVKFYSSVKENKLKSLRMKALFMYRVEPWPAIIIFPLIIIIGSKII